jgi:hypothetical protein
MAHAENADMGGVGFMGKHSLVLVRRGWAA